ncbi:DUF3027 domain-containing protein [Bifidobacterium tsurumiense]|uniref:DUF3027 domain-containing protein n=1 Tax=Bifidobacterium tsurumiense TaxID=356829 RepID=A0A087EFI2_9BIFI|nr:DUF3027 domain-containing protein [Bifidobacterium tsurumiense]KFJ06533.1 hypothetical protein BITS_1218 [Bifidobacterium tsurumiense]
MVDARHNPQELAREVALNAADNIAEVGDYVQTIPLEDGMSDFRFVSLKRGYEGWQWSVTLYHDVEADMWTVNESSLIPTDQALQPPAWIPWKDRLLPSDLSVTDSIGTSEDDDRLEQGFRKTEPKLKGQVDGEAADGEPSEVDGKEGAEASDPTADGAKQVEEHSESNVDTQTQAERSDGKPASEVAAGSGGTTHEDSTDAQQDGVVEPASSTEDVDDAVREFALSRRRVLSPLGRAQTTQRWYEGPRGPKSLSTKTADGNVCSTCGFFVPLQGELGLMFGVCANKWSPDDGRVVSLDHGCGEHSEIEPPEASHLWIQPKPAYDNVNIDIVKPVPRAERDDIDLLEELDDVVEDQDGENTSKGDATESSKPRSRKSRSHAQAEEASDDEAVNGKENQDEEQHADNADADAVTSQTSAQAVDSSQQGHVDEATAKSDVDAVQTSDQQTQGMQVLTPPVPPIQAQDPSEGSGKNLESSAGEDETSSVPQDNGEQNADVQEAEDIQTAADDHAEESAALIDAESKQPAEHPEAEDSKVGVSDNEASGEETSPHASSEAEDSPEEDGEEAD